jgi:hypothetical protein
MMLPDYRSLGPFGIANGKTSFADRGSLFSVIDWDGEGVSSIPSYTGILYYINNN